MTEYERTDLRVTTKQAERALGVSAATIQAWGVGGGINVNQDGTINVSELERVVADRGGDSTLVRAMLQLPRLALSWSTGDVAELLRCGRDTVVNLCDNGHLQAYRTPHGYRRVTRTALAQYLTEHPGPLAGPMGLRVPTKPGTQPTPRRTKRKTKRKPKAEDAG